MVTEKILVDTSILIDYFRTAKGMYLELLEHARLHRVDLYISSVSVFEIFTGDSSKKEEQLLLETVSNFKVIPFDKELGRFCGELLRDFRLKVPIADLFIAASCIYISAELATNNKKHFLGIPKLKFFEI